MESGEQPAEVIQNDSRDLEVEGFHAASLGGTVDAGVGQLVAGANADGEDAVGAVVGRGKAQNGLKDSPGRPDCMSRQAISPPIRPVAPV